MHLHNSHRVCCVLSACLFHCPDHTGPADWFLLLPQTGVAGVEMHSQAPWEERVHFPAEGCCRQSLRQADSCPRVPRAVPTDDGLGRRMKAWPPPPASKGQSHSPPCPGLPHGGGGSTVDRDRPTCRVCRHRPPGNACTPVPALHPHAGNPSVGRPRNETWRAISLPRVAVRWVAGQGFHWAVASRMCCVSLEVPTPLHT